MIPQHVGYETVGLYDGIGNLIGIQVIYGTRRFTWSIVGDDLVLVAFY